MSTRLSRCLKAMQTVGFWRSTENGKIPSLELLHHGTVYANQLQHHWLSMRQLAVNFDHIEHTTEMIDQSRFSFTHSKQFREQFQQLRQSYPSKAKCPTLIKHQKSMPYNSKSNTIFQHQSNVTQLITDFFVEPHRGIEHFYNLQRESKIWWMRYSSNPSRYAIVPYDCHSDPEHCQAIDIKAGFGEAGEVTVEQLSLVPLPAGNDFELPDARTTKMQLPMVIRSVIELEPATCALLLDGCDHGRESRSLLLNRVLAPYQCGIVAMQKTEKSSTELHDLCAHMVDVLQSARLRLHFIDNQGYSLAKNKEQMTQQLEQSDCLGVPYMLLLDERHSLTNGLMQLRSRDTQLAEMIHISDLPDYLLNIFRSF
ncbi:DNA polymerase subunit gamma-2, mitochondrial isoform X1 [Drosophila sulfurigaster albostrigata]|uniref:DNA polymerase subunit gamma-2, mitochondrial isoform X1 n=1 Tax=Drosophila sulfurigaster albostrigata TaxID=89887 RepID=UPI002D21ECC5|nr:DNA polymerase subunit gamma-2, mitochondrial isoform X1 [Drosophila sulfurigaster albostrigata]